MQIVIGQILTSDKKMKKFYKLKTGCEKGFRLCTQLC